MDQPSGATEGARRVEEIRVRIRVGDDRMGGTDDPVFLQLSGPGGREFRLALSTGRSFRRGSDNRFVLGPPGNEGVNVQEPRLNDPSNPALDLASIEGINLRKALNPIPNVRGLAEMDDRLLVESIDVQIRVKGEDTPARWSREGPIWLGLVCGLRMGLVRSDV